MTRSTDFQEPFTASELCMEYEEMDSIGRGQTGRV